MLGRLLNYTFKSRTSDSITYSVRRSVSPSIRLLVGPLLPLLNVRDWYCRVNGLVYWILRSLLLWDNPDKDRDVLINRPSLKSLIVDCVHLSFLPNANEKIVAYSLPFCRQRSSKFNSRNWRKSKKWFSFHTLFTLGLHSSCLHLSRVTLWQRLFLEPIYRSEKSVTSVRYFRSW